MRDKWKRYTEGTIYIMQTESQTDKQKGGGGGKQWAKKERKKVTSSLKACKCVCQEGTMFCSIGQWQDMCRLKCFQDLILSNLTPLLLAVLKAKATSFAKDTARATGSENPWCCPPPRTSILSTASFNSAAELPPDSLVLVKEVIKISLGQRFLFPEIAHGRSLETSGSCRTCTTVSHLCRSPDGNVGKYRQSPWMLPSSSVLHSWCFFLWPKSLNSWSSLWQ